MAIVTNKPRYLTEPLLKQLAIGDWFDCVICGDDMPEKKPHPKPLLTACSIMHVEAQNSIYLGDAKCDIEGGNNAGMTTLLVSWGYYDESQEDINSWHAAHFVEDVEQLENLLSVAENE